jgi:hypothetical protein
MRSCGKSSAPGNFDYLGGPADVVSFQTAVIADVGRSGFDVGFETNAD